MGTSKNSLYIRGWLICLIGAIFYWYEYLLRIEPAVMVTELMKHFQWTAGGFGLIVAFYYYAYTPMQLAAGVLLDRYGTRIILGLAIVFCTGGSLLFSISSSTVLIAMARFFIGFGSSFAFIGVLKLGAEWLPKKQFAFLVGLATSLGMLAGMLGDVFLTSLLHDMGWQKVLHLGTIVGIVLIPIVFLFIRDTPTAKHLPVRLTTSFHQTFAGLKEIVKNPQMWICGLIANTFFLSLSAFAELWGIKFLQTVYNIDAQKASVACSFVFFGWLVGGPFSGWFSDYIKSRKTPLWVGGILSTLAITLIIFHPFSMSFGVLSLLLFLFGAFSSTEILCFAISKEINEHHMAATSAAFTNFLIMIGGIVFQPLMGFLLDWMWTGTMVEGVRVYSSWTYQIVFLTIPLSMFVGSLLVFKLKETLSEEAA